MDIVAYQTRVYFAEIALGAAAREQHKSCKSN